MNKHSILLLISLLVLIFLSIFLGISIIHAVYWMSAIVALAIALIMYKLIQSYSRRTHDIQRLINTVQSFEPSPSPQRENLDKTLISFDDIMKQLETSIAFYKMLLNKADFAMIVTDQKDNVRWANEVMIDMSGKSQINKLYELKKALPNFSLLAKDMLPREVKRVKLSIEQNERNFAVSMIPAKDENGSFKIFTINNIQPILEKKENEIWTELIRSFTDEIMVYMTPINSLAETFANEEGIDYESEMMVKAMRTIYRRSNDLGRLIYDYQKLLKITPLDKQKVFVKDIVESVARQLKEISITFTYDIEPLHMQIEVDKKRMEQVLLNLLKNAQEACYEDEKPEIKLKVSRKGYHVSISVLDEGCGIQPEIKDRLFTPFFTTKNGNAGMGLSISRLIVNAHGGTIDISSYVDEETCVTIRL